MKLIATKVKRKNTRSIENLNKKRKVKRKESESEGGMKARRMRKKKSLIERRKRRLKNKANKVSKYIQKKSK